MKTGFDTGFFVSLLKEEPEAVSVWKRIIDGSDQGFISSLSLFELWRLALRGITDREMTEVLISKLPIATTIVWIEEEGLLKRAANLSLGAGLSSIDALILASLLESGVEKIYTTDRDLEAYSKKGVKIINLRRKK